ncbi:MAG: protein kinase [Planctomycetota bacterium]
MQPPTRTDASQGIESSPNSGSEEALPATEVFSLPASSDRGSDETKSIPSFRYQCVCGREVSVLANERVECPTCGRVVNGELLQRNLSLTVSVADIDRATSDFAFEQNQPNDNLVGQSLLHFRIDQVIGRGGMGTVYRALDTSLQRFVAVKLIQRRKGGSGSTSDQSGSGTNEDLSDALEEAIAQARLNHPNVTTIYYVGREGEAPFMAMELLTGGTLADQIKEGPLSYRMAIGHILRVASALRHAHEFDIVHADIKPSNLLLSDSGEVKLSDFGLARSASRKSSQGSVSGTPNYLAPELVSGRPPSIQSDMYALGVTLFELLFGRYPFQLSGSTLLEQLSTHAVAPIEYPVPWPKDVPEEVIPVLDRLLAKAPEERYPDYDSLIDQLERIQPVSSVYAGIVPRLGAFVVDQMLALGVMLLAYTIFYAVLDSSLLLTVGGFLPVLLAYVWWVRSGYRTPGRMIFQLKIVDQHGLFLPPRQRALREALRSALLFSMLAEAFHDALTIFVFLGTMIMFILCNAVSMIASGGSRAFHDWICHSNVTFETVQRRQRSRRNVEAE